VLVVALCAYDVYSAAVPNDEDSADKAVQARPAPVAPVGAHAKNKAAKQQQNKNTPPNETVEGGAEGQRKQRVAQKKGGLKKAGNGKQQLKVRRGKFNSSKKPTVSANVNREELSNKRNKNQFNKAPVDKLDRNVFTKTAAGDDEYVDYGPPQAPPAPGNRLLKMPNFSAHQKPVDSSVNSGGSKPTQGNVKMVKPMPFLPPNVAQKADMGDSEPGSSLNGAQVIRHARPMPQDGIDTQVPQKAILPYEQPIRSDDDMLPPNRPRIVVEGPDFYQPNPEGGDGKVGIMQGDVGIMTSKDKINMPPTIDSQPEIIARPAVIPEMSVMSLKESP
jgi:hypothetical protein